MLYGTDVFHFDCECSSFDHSVRFCVDQESGDVWLNTRLNTYLPWWRRLWRASVYVVRPRYGVNGHYDETLIDHQDFGKIRELLAKAETYRRQSTQPQQSAQPTTILSTT